MSRSEELRAQAEEMTGRKDDILAERLREEATPIDTEEAYDNMLDDCCEPCRVGNITFDPSRVLRELDPIAYNCGFSDWIDGAGYEEIDGDYWDQDEVDRIRDEIDQEIADLEEEADEAEEEENEEE